MKTIQRMILVYNPRSSRFAEVKTDVIDKVYKLKGYMIGKYEVEHTDVDQNSVKLAKILKNGDLVLAAGGDATAQIAANSIIKSNKDATLAVLPYGNFNDLSRTLGTKTIDDIFMNAPNRQFEVVRDDGSGIASEPRDDGRERSGPRTAYSSIRKLYPLEIIVDGKLFRYATCYVTIGMTADAVKLYDTPKVRKKLKTNFGRKISSYTSLASWYFKNRHKKVFLPEFKLNGELQHKKTSDYAAINGRSMARVMKGGEDYQKPTIFRSETDRLTNFWRLFKLMAKSIFHRVPGTETTGDTLEFIKPATVAIQAEGEYHTFKNVKTIEIKKGDKCLKVIES